MSTDVGAVSQSSTDGSRTNGIGILGLLNIALRHQRIAFVIVAVCVVLGTISFALAPPSYTATSAFVESSSGSSAPSSLSGLAAAYLGVSSGSGASSAEVYAQLLTSRRFFDELAKTEFSFLPEGETDSIKGTIGSLNELPGENEAEVHAAAMDFLESTVTATHDLQTGIVVLRTTARWPELSVLMNQKLLQLLDEFNGTERRTRGAAERSFVGARLTEAKNELSEAERKLERFSAENRSYASSPALSVQFSRLSRELELKQQLYASLETAYQQARIEEVRNTPLITVLEPPETAVRPGARSLSYSIGMAGLVGVLLAIIWIALSELWHRERALNPTTYDFVAGRLGWLSRLRFWRRAGA